MIGRSAEQDEKGQIEMIRKVRIPGMSSETKGIDALADWADEKDLQYYTY